MSGYSYFTRMNQKKKAMLVLIVTCLAILGLFACNIPNETTLVPTESKKSTLNSVGEFEQVYSDLASIQEKGVLVVGTSITKPFEFHTSETEELSGFDVDIAKYIADKLGVELEWVEMPFANLIPAIVEQKVDMTIAAMYITEEREALVDFSQPYVKTGLIMVTQASNVDSIHEVQDLAGKIVGVKIGATGETFAKELISEGIDVQIVPYQNSLDSLLDLEVGRIDVVFNDYLNTLVYLREYEADLFICTGTDGNVLFLSNAGLGIAIHQENDELLDTINAILDDMETSGYTDLLYTTWLDGPRKN